MEREFALYLINTYKPHEVALLLKEYIYIASEGAILNFTKEFCIRNPEIVDWLKTRIDLKDKTTVYYKQRTNMFEAAKGRQFVDEEYPKLAIKYNLPNREHKK